MPIPAIRLIWELVVISTYCQAPKWDQIRRRSDQIQGDLIMLVAGLVVIVFVGLIIFLLVSNVDSLPKPFLKFLGYFLLFVSSIELVFLVWILVYTWISPWSLWSLSFDAFWREQLSYIYFIKIWLYSWFWNDLLNLLFVFLPAVLFLSLRTTLTTVLGFWALSASKRQSSQESKAIPDSEAGR